ncbi:hydrogenase maturation protease [Mesobacterium sp. TK19101]|uniref:Hydrogenase maturation protease n=1 Tax=Mesobacterium hydrothermale TaxID=3111907 RepID=A0ABU6HJZ0_9RHOB|nr:hydrogenase maturation protease [Mesobacterium sp. TK19101]MEC3862773.1 hydrogenase maturation protease [Mesobacterium sp. TK19101]
MRPAEVELEAAADVSDDGFAAAPDRIRGVVVLGIGNTLLTDDGIGVHVVTRLQAEGIPDRVLVRDGGTMGLSLLTDFATDIGIIAIDAMELGDAPGTVRRFDGVAMDRQLGGPKKTAHEVALSDLLSAAHLSGCAPDQRALIAIQPDVTTLGLTPTDAVAAALPEAVAIVRQILKEWLDG